MQVDNRILDDLARVAGGALGAFSSLREEAEGQLRAQLERVLSRMDVVSREEYEAVRAMAAKAREEQEAMTERLAALEATVASLSAAKAPLPVPVEAAGVPAVVETDPAGVKPEEGKPGSPGSKATPAA
ncbi:accessory factor UbiK family protein [Azospirillum melinis]|uniref:accessory factor UbiK family protein n=1 Tax=Azospirillum melinis TaxID=328839 RepID=UPI001FEBE10B|nr:accessory factor UbiK family protein [Azospirillum melinis]MBP2304437.1 BMFP domain-containing protein YqiC [Azospirillum melinis]